MAESRRRLAGSMRARTVIAAVLVVEATLIAAGVLVTMLLRTNLSDSAQAEAELRAQRVAAQLAEGVDPRLISLPEDAAVQVVDGEGEAVRQSAAFDEVDEVLDFAPEQARPRAEDQEAEDGRGTVRSRVGFATVSLPGQPDDYRFAVMTVDLTDGEHYEVYAGHSLRAQREALADATLAMAVALPAVLIVVGVVTWHTVSRALRPVEAIRVELAEITATDLERRVPVPDTGDEVNALAVTTNSTLEALETAVERQRRFVADASHELRSPLAVLRAQLEVAGDHPELLDLDATRADVERLQTLATDLLLLARLDAGQRARPVEVDLADLVRGEAARRRVSDRVPTRVRVEAEPRVSGVRGQLERALDNLLSNAQRHADTAVEASVTAPEKGVVEIAVADDGPGIPAEQRERVFDRFVRLDEARTRDEGGAGLGLALVREIARAHGGEARAAESALGGARLTLRLPAPDGGSDAPPEA